MTVCYRRALQCPALSVTVTHFGLLSRTAATHCISHAERNKATFNNDNQKNLSIIINNLSGFVITHTHAHTHTCKHTRKHRQRSRCLRLSSKLESPAIGCLLSLPHCVKLANSAGPGASRSKSQLGDWLPQKRIVSRKKRIALLRTLVRSELNSPGRMGGATRSSVTHYNDKTGV